MTKNEIPNGVVNPFSEKFIGSWDLWKLWRLEHDNFKYKGVISEQMALKGLVELTEGDEDKAIKIIEQSIARGWTGFYPLKSGHGKSKKQSSGASSGTTEKGDLRSRVQAAVNAKFGGGEQTGSGDHLKAV